MPNEESKLAMWHRHKGPDSFGRNKSEFFIYFQGQLEYAVEFNRKNGLDVNNPLIFNEILTLVEQELIQKHPRFKDFIQQFVDANRKHIKI